jgi:DNA-directed RNA polymerase specialized sigma subunit
VKEEMTLREIAAELGITHQSVMEILEKALKKVKAKLQERGINWEDLYD